MEDFNYAVDSALSSNLSDLTCELSVINEQRMLEISDIAASFADSSIALLNDGLDIYETLSVLSSGLDFGEYHISDLNSQENTEVITGVMKTSSYSDKVIFSDIYVSELHKRAYALKETDFLFESHNGETFTYVRNPFSDEAYDVFSQEFEDPRLKYSSSFKECAQAVDSGDVTYCLLPLEERGVRLPTVSEIIYRNDFKINSVTPVFGTDGNADMKYALVSKNFTVPMKQAGDDRYLEIRIGTSGNGISLSELLVAIEYFSMSVYRINTSVFNADTAPEVNYSVVIRDGEAGFVRLLTYLTLFSEDFVPIGIYKNLE